MAESNLGDARVVMSSVSKHFQIIDLDPYSTAAPFLDSAIQAADDGALLCITSTDGRSLNGLQHDTGYAWYGLMPMNTAFSKEFGVRALMTTLISTASRYARSIEPLLCLAINFYVRIFVRITDKKQPSKITAGTTSLCFYSPSSCSFWLQPMGLIKAKNTSKTIVPASLELPNDSSHDPLTGGSLKIGGPVYTGPLFDHSFIDSVMAEIRNNRYLKTEDRVRAVLNTAKAEIDAPFYYDFSQLCGIVAASCPSRAIVVGALEKMGYQVSITHCERGNFKTTAPPEALWDIVRAWYFAEGKTMPTEDGVKKALLSAPYSHEVCLDRDVEIVKRLKEEKRICKFYENPTKDFGPKAAASSKKKVNKE